MYPVLTTVSHIPRRTINLYTNKNIILKLPYMLRYNILRFDSTVTATSLAVCVCVAKCAYISILETHYRLANNILYNFNLCNGKVFFVVCFSIQCCVLCGGWLNNVTMCVLLLCTTFATHTQESRFVFRNARNRDAPETDAQRIGKRKWHNWRATTCSK